MDDLRKRVAEIRRDFNETVYAVVGEPAIPTLLDYIARLEAVADALVDLEAYDPTPETYTGGQSEWSQARHRKAFAVKQALKEAGWDV